MRRLFRREPMAPDAVIARADLGHDKVLAAAVDRSGTWLLGTPVNTCR